MHFKQFEEAGKKVGKPIVQIPPQAYIPIPMGIEKWLNWSWIISSSLLP